MVCALGCGGRLFCLQLRLAALCPRPTLNAASQEVTHKSFTIPPTNLSLSAPLLSQSLIYFIERDREREIKSHPRKAASRFAEAEGQHSAYTRVWPSAGRTGQYSGRLGHLIYSWSLHTSWHALAEAEASLVSDEEPEAKWRGGRGSQAESMRRSSWPRLPSWSGCSVE